MSFPIIVYSQTDTYDDTTTVFNDGTDTINYYEDSMYKFGRILNNMRHVDVLENGSIHSLTPSPADNTEILTLESEGYFDLLGIDHTIFNAETNWYVKRTPMFATELISVIRKNNLQYLPSTFYLDKTNINLQPTIFINADKTQLYLFYSNVKSKAQNYKLNFTNLVNIWPGALSVSASVAQLYLLNAAQCYSTAGKSRLFDICNCYSALNPHEFELRNITGPIDNVPENWDDVAAESENRCLTAPANSFRYFVLNIAPYKPRFSVNSNQKHEFTIYPNPSEDWIYIFGGEIQIEQIEMYSITGILIATYSSQNVIDVSDVAKGFYILKINNAVVLNFVVQ